MTNSQRLAIVRAHLRGWLQDQNDDPQVAPAVLSESIVIRNEFYCGRSFDLGSHRAIWFIEEDELKIHDAAGNCIVVFQGDEICSPVEIEGIDSAPEVIKLDIATGVNRSSIDAAPANEIADETSENQHADTDERDDDVDIRRAA